jgi:hypothetical protein
MGVHELTRTEYRTARTHDYAGPVTTLEDDTVEAWKQNCPDWTRKHWAMLNGGGEGTLLVPVNVVADHPRSDATEATR